MAERISETESQLKTALGTYKQKLDNAKKILDGFSTNWAEIRSDVVKPSMQECARVLITEGIECRIDESTMDESIRLSISQDKTLEPKKWPSINFAKEKAPYIVIQSFVYGGQNMKNSVVITNVTGEYVEHSIGSFVKANLEKWGPNWL